MIEKLLEKAFEKIGRVTGNRTENGRATHLEYEIRENYKVSVSAKTLVRYLKGNSSPKLEVRNALSEFLGYDSYEDFVNHNSDADKEKVESTQTIKAGGVLNFKRIWVSLSAVLVAGLAYFGLMESKECMVWVDDHYEKSECSGQALEFSLNETELEKFRKIEVCDTTTFFKKYDPIIWYDKFNNELEYFTYYGRNPINGRTLRPITQTIIDNHVKPCSDDLGE